MAFEKKNMAFEQASVQHHWLIIMENEILFEK